MYVVLNVSAVGSKLTDCMKHWGLILTDSYGNPILHHASNRTGPWKYEEREARPEQSMSLIVLIRVDKVKSHSHTMDVIKSIPAVGTPSRRTGEDFTCRIWIKDVLVALHECGEIVLPTNIGKFTLAFSKVLGHYIELMINFRCAGGPCCGNWSRVQPFRREWSWCNCHR